jgi:predicted nucleic acid-binding protein
MKKIFFDANILIDASDGTRPFHEAGKRLFDHLLANIEQYSLYTSCDLVTTIYYILSKSLNTQEALNNIKLINNLIEIIEFGNDEISEAIELMERNDKYVDLEDTIQYVMARMSGCDYIITNNKNFASGDVPTLTSEEALKELQ